MAKRKPVDFRTYNAPQDRRPFPHGMLATTWDTTTNKGRVFKWHGLARDWPHAVENVKQQIAAQFPDAGDFWDWCSFPLSSDEGRDRDTLQEVQP